MEDRALVKSGTGATTVASVTGCNGVLKVVLLALDIDCGPQPPSVAAVEAVEPFLPARIGAAPPSDHSVRPASLLAYRHVTDPTSPPVAFGVPTAALRADQLAARPYVGHPATCLSLWEIPGNGLVLALERLSDNSSRLVDSRIDPLDEGAEFRTAIDGFLAPFGLSMESGPNELFPGLNRLMPVPETYRPLRELVVYRHRGGTGAVIEALAIEVLSSGGDRVRELVDGSGSLSRAARPRGRAWAWDRITLGDRPVQPGAAIAVREDAAAVLFDLEATVAGHDYLGCGTREMIYALLPWVALRAGSSTDFWRVLSHLRSREDLAGDRLVAALDDVATMQARKMERALLHKESQHDARCPSWTGSTQLRSLLVRRVYADNAELDAELAEAVRVVEHSQLRSTELRGERHSRLARGWSVAAGALAIVVLFAALATVPVVVQPTLFPHWVPAVITVAALTGTAITAAVLWRRQ
ncbi:hypothetical protein [Rhodococcus chondri]|uniref:Integral membrane protein n=1 Tax=Rhodococcus chondri TaxID=3065941 RepID=A0ABU7JZB4_9NOCA|nr:hypothetical protein [Rhodococcus sp. CC-R104]MEE2035321.1 hypothetical protein [Rhodococcus sp. CC-R104]